MSILRVAKYAGVSTATVSRVLNSVPVVRQSTVRNVQAALHALKYDPLEVKRGPRPGHRRKISPCRSGMIAVITVGLGREKLQHPVTHGVVNAIISSARQSRVKVLLDEMPGLEEMSPVIRDREVDGAVVFLADEAPLDVLSRIHRLVPTVWAMGGQAGVLPVDHVSENNIAVGYLAHEYLEERGCRDIAFLTMVPQKRNAIQRGQSLAAAAAGRSHRCRSLLVGGDRHIRDLYGKDVVSCQTLNELVQVFASLSPRPTGLFIDRDSTTARVYPLLARFGIQPGRDLQVVSCDNEEMALAALYPRPASIDLGAEELGARVVRRLLLRIENQEEPPVFIQTMPRLEPGEEVANEINSEMNSTKMKLVNRSATVLTSQF